jgi:hypothetical protein
MSGTGQHHLKWNYPGSEDQKWHAFSHMWTINLIQIQQYYEKQVTQRGGHIGVREGKRRKLRKWNGWCTLYTRMNLEVLNLLKSP